MTPIGKPISEVGVGVERLGTTPPTATVERVGSGSPCLEEDGFIVWYCPGDDTQVRTPVTCGEARLCPTCSKRWSYRAARKAAWRLEHVGKRKVRLSPEGVRLSPRHVVVSYISAIDPLTPEGMSAHMRHAWATLKRMGATGGVGVYHPWRHSPGEGAPAATVWRLGVHSHWLVWGFLDTEKRPEYMFVRVLRGHQDTIVGTLAYLFDHAGVAKGSPVCRYYGIASYAKCKGVPAAPVPDPVPLCPECGGPMTRLEGVANGGFDPYVDATAWHWRDRVLEIEPIYVSAPSREENPELWGEPGDEADRELRS